MGNCTEGQAISDTRGCLRESCRQIEESLSDAVDLLTGIVGPVPAREQPKAVDADCQLDDLDNRLCTIAAKVSFVTDLARAINRRI